MNSFAAIPDSSKFLIRVGDECKVLNCYVQLGIRHYEPGEKYELDISQLCFAPEGQTFTKISENVFIETEQYNDIIRFQHNA
jgi:hypothetical protein